MCSADNHLFAKVSSVVVHVCIFSVRRIFSSSMHVFTVNGSFTALQSVDGREMKVVYSRADSERSMIGINWRYSDGGQCGLIDEGTR